MRLVRASWLVAHSKAGRVLPRRQEVPEEAFLSVDELRKLWDRSGPTWSHHGNPDGVLPIVVISFCWLSASHPDPEGQQLAKVAAALEREKSRYAQAHDWFRGFEEMGVFWDWVSLHQKDPALWRPCVTRPATEQTRAERQLTQKYDGSRTADEQAAFRFALHNTMDLWRVRRPNRCLMMLLLRAAH